MNDEEISTFLEPHLKVLRAVRDGAGDREIREAKKSLGVIVVKFNHPAVADCARRSLGLLDKALDYVDFQKKNKAATDAADYFAERIFGIVHDCEKNRTA